MAVSFLTDDQQQRYGRYAGDPTPDQLARYFHLDEADRELIAWRRGDHRRLGFAIQLCTVRFLGTFPEDQLETPLRAIHHVASQLGLVSPAGIAQYCTGEQRWEHATEIRLHAAVDAQLSRVDLLEILLEIAARTGFTTGFTRVTKREARAADLTTSIYAVLIAEVCNAGIEPRGRATDQAGASRGGTRSDR